MFPMKDFAARFRELLNEFDEAAARGEGDTEALDEANAEFEDALFMLEAIDLRGDDWREEVADALEELGALCADFRRAAGDSGEIPALADRLDMAVQLARGSL